VIDKITMFLQTLVMKIKPILSVFTVLTCLLVLSGSGNAPEPKTKDAPLMTNNAQDTSVTLAQIETNKGVIDIELYSGQAPKTVANFVKLANEGFYDGIIFHRVIPQFMIQTGDPTGTGMGGPGYSFEDEFVSELSHSEAGVLSMANSGPNTNGSQFFITEAATPWLDGKHAVFGKVTAGMDVVHKIAGADKDGSDKPREEIKMVKVSIKS
jgi:cyclophilin family peptidyl-prolyl cis-trans isomerase